jgi:exopolyphosphatase/guanosine-5'-triphosphate,3'-diphosphate pyrophosphatase
VMDMLKSIQDHSPDFYVALEEYLDSFITRLQSQLSCGKVANLIVSGNAIDHLTNACGAQRQDGYAVLKKDALVAFHQHTRTQSLMQIATRQRMSEDAAEIFYSLFNIFAKMASFLDSDNIIAPDISLFDPLTQQTLFAAHRTDFQKSVRAYALASARTIAKRYGSNLAHIENVYENAILLFDKTKRYHGLKSHHRFLLELAVLLHDCGHFTSTHHHANSTYSIIVNSFISGVSEEDLMIVGNIARHNEFLQGAAGNLKKTEIQTYKLSALLWLANSLDKSHQQKIRSPKVWVSGNTLKIVATSDENLLLEQWAFAECIPFFEEVSGLKPEFVRQTLLL